MNRQRFFGGFDQRGTGSADAVTTRYPVPRTRSSHTPNGSKEPIRDLPLQSEGLWKHRLGTRTWRVVALVQRMARVPPSMELVMTSPCRVEGPEEVEQR